MADYIRAEIRARAVAEYGAQLVGSIVAARCCENPYKYPDRIIAIREDIANARAQLDIIEEALGLTEAATETEAA